MFRVLSQTKDGYPSSHGYYATVDEAEQAIAELSFNYSNRNTKYWVRTIK